MGRTKLHKLRKEIERFGVLQQVRDFAFTPFYTAAVQAVYVVVAPQICNALRNGLAVAQDGAVFNTVEIAFNPIGQIDGVTAVVGLAPQNFDQKTLDRSQGIVVDLCHPIARAPSSG